ncbi:MAG: TolC family protein, partial [Merismopedia sp. SIO2A8]|nr:TolC family protein [Merismopedia sp. SIO2A8]
TQQPGQAYAVEWSGNVRSEDDYTIDTELNVGEVLELAQAEPSEINSELEPDVETDSENINVEIDTEIELEDTAPAALPSTVEESNTVPNAPGSTDSIESSSPPTSDLSSPDVLPDIRLGEDSDSINGEANTDFTEVPDYLLSPSNPLFVPVNPETVETAGTQPISLAEALEISRRNSRELQSALQQLEQSQEGLRQQRAAYLPTLQLQSTLTHSDDDLPGEFGDFDGSATVDTVFNTVIRAEYDLFTSGLRSANVRAAEESVRSQELQVEVVKEDLRLNITTAYYDLQQSDQLVRIAEDTVEQSQISLRDALAREQAGVGTRFDRLQAEVDLANDEQQLSNALRDQSIARRQLADLLSLPPGLDLSASDPVEVAGAWAMPLEDTLLLAYRNRAELEQQLSQRELEKQQARAQRANRWPQLSIFAQAQSVDLLDVTRGPNDVETLSAGLQLDWLLYNGGSTRAGARQEAIAAELAETQFADTREAIRFEVEQQYLNLGASFKNIQTASSAVDLAKEALRLARLRFGAGVGIQSDVLEAQTRLTEAEVNLVTAILDYNRALVAIQRAVSNWPDNNLSADPAREF